MYARRVRVPGGSKFHLALGTIAVPTGFNLQPHIFPWKYIPVELQLIVDELQCVPNKGFSKWD